MLDKLSGEVELLERHLTVMRAVINHGPIGIMKLTEELGLPQHRIRYSLRVLEQMQYIKATPSGAMPTRKACQMLENFDVELAGLIAQLEALHRKQAS
jgi:predicted transcriptional regulator